MKRIVRERIEILMNEAERRARDRPELARRYVRLARALAMRHRVRIPAHYKRRFCQRCHTYLVPGRDSRVRIHRGRVIITCLHCGHQMRIPAVKIHDRE
ncbi:MAG: ribonuclease P protein component 4 [Methanoculleaceae archaeon]